MKKIAILGLCAMLFAGSNVSAMSDWAVPEASMANTRGLVTESLLWGSVTENITREEFCYLAMNLYKNMGGEAPELVENPFSDTDNKAVVEAYSLGIINGKTDDLFYPEAPITRQEIAKIIMLTVNSIYGDGITQKEVCELCHFEDFDEIHNWAIEFVENAVKYDIINGVSKTRLFPQGNATREQAIVIMNRAYENFSKMEVEFSLPEIQSVSLGDNLSVKWEKVPEASSYCVILRDRDKNIIASKSTEKTKAELSMKDVSYGDYSVIVGAKVGDFSWVYSLEESVSQKPPEYVEKYPTLEDKTNRVFSEGEAFIDYDTAKAGMVTISVPVWNLDESGEKYSSSLDVEVNANLAEDILQIFTEIYNDSERFPIKNLGGFSWRTTAFGSVSQHSYGTCIDINWDENYYCYPSGQAITGSFWKPYENPYSIPADGSVVKVFEKYGFKWGGNAWTNLKDYMHFPYLGK